jgi:hypothetical protein
MSKKKNKYVTKDSFQLVFGFDYPKVVNGFFYRKYLRSYTLAPRSSQKKGGFGLNI